MKETIENLNHVSDNVWAVTLIGLAVCLAFGSIWFHDLLPFATSIASIGGVIFRGGSGQKPPPPPQV
jgi:hypothetical protein